MKRPPLKDYQARAVIYAEKHPYSILALDPGLGKTRCAIEVRDKLNLKCLVICPSYLILNWVKEIKKWGAKDSQITTFRTGKEIYEVCDSDYVITSYSLIQKAEHLFEWANMVVLDEGHAIKSMQSKRSQFIHRCIFENSIKRVHILTGTPIKNRVAEFYSLLSLMFYNPRAADSQFLKTYPSEIDFADQFSFNESYDYEYAKGRWTTVMKWTGIRNIKELKTYLADKYIRIRSSDVLDLPPITEKTTLISEYADKALLKAFHAYFKYDEDPDDEKLEREDRTASVLPEHKAMAALKKVPFTIKYVENLLEEVDCCLVYSDHVAPAMEIAKHFGVQAICGAMPSSKRSEMADAFQAGEGKILVATIGSMKEGKDLYRSQHVVFNDYSWIPGDMKQVIYRIQRIGQTAPCTVHRIYGSPQDEQISNVISEKQETIDKAT